MKTTLYVTAIILVVLLSVCPVMAEKVTLVATHTWEAEFMERQHSFDQMFMEKYPHIEKW